MSRTIAYVVDALVVSIAAAAVVTGLGMVASVVGNDARDLARAVTAAYFVVLPGLFTLYCAIFWALAGRTPGMAVAGLRVVGTGRRRLHWLSALVRAVLLAYFPIGALWLIVDRRHQAIHDKLARTLVVRAAGQPGPPGPPGGGARRVSRAQRN
ncbi:hypothetical protein Ate02nite_46410 [Paractinoplanes tereljensis]|uniref:RDD domain-containing protein n=1 Tax=Paractinoplanes tereljensis TaxID=571912 RepID=A0A919NPX3_9ACTN|nr:hypothetical protein Ate02nite_46410 [Actinoplanes tereljensis]